MEQRIWLEKRGRVGGNAWVLIKVGKGSSATYVLLWWKDALSIGRMTRFEMQTRAEVYATVAFPAENIVDSLYRGGPEA